jgi:hypothetical protein
MASQMNDWRVIGPMIAALIGLYGFVLKHLSNTDRHAGQRDIVFRDVCKPQMDRLADSVTKVEDCVEKDLGALKELMEQRFDSLERLIKNNGNQPGRIRT